MKKNILVLLITVFVFLLVGCKNSTTIVTKKTQSLDRNEEITLKIGGSWSSFSAIDPIIDAFETKYSNVQVEYVQVADYSSNIERVLSSDDDEVKVDLFCTTNITPNGTLSNLVPYTYNLYSNEYLDLSDTFEGLIDNFEYKPSDGSSAELYCVPFGAEVRGLYVNVTLLNSLNLDIPTNQEELLHCCEALKTAGYIPFQGNPGSFAQRLLYPWICNQIANNADYETVYNKIANKDYDTFISLFGDAYEFMYTLIENDYYDYETAEAQGFFIDTSHEGTARYLLDIMTKNEETGEWEKTSDVGRAAFIPDTYGLEAIINEMKSDYHSQIEYTFIPAPVSDDGGYVYLSPSTGISISKKSNNIDWAIEFLNFLFEEGNNKTFAEGFYISPNTSDALEYIDIDVPENHICHLGQVTFQYVFYNIINSTLTNVSKGNKQKYMIDNGDGTYSLHTLDYYYDILKETLNPTT